MKKITIVKEIEVFEFKELDEEVQEKIKKDFLETKEAWFFTTSVEDDLDYFFPNSELKFEYDFSCCQGSGSNIYGKIKIDDFLNAYELLNDFKNCPFDSKEIDLIHEILDCNIETLSLAYNSDYTYSLIDRNEFDNQILEQLELFEVSVSNELKEVIYKLNDEVIEMMEHLNDYFYKYGENYFFVVDDWEIKEDYFFQGYFTKDGERYINVDINNDIII